MIPVHDMLATVQYGGELWVVPVHAINEKREVLVAVEGKLQFLKAADITYGKDDPLRNVKRGQRLTVHYADHSLCGSSAGQIVTLESDIDKRLANEAWEATA